MKKSAFLFLFAAFALVACEKGTTYADLESGDVKEETHVDGPTKSFTFTIKGEFEAATFKAPGMRRAGGTTYLNDSGSDITDLWVYDYMSGTLIQSVHQSAGDENFGKPKMSLAYGEHHIYFVASRGADPVVNDESHIISWSTVRDTFWKDYEVNVVSTSNGNRAVTLDRVATKLRILIDDEVPAACASISLTPDKWYYGLDWVTGDAVTAKRQAITVNVPDSYVGTIGETIGSASIVGAPFKRNRATEYHGSLFGSAGSMVVSISDSWEDSKTGTW